jgi:hypothetical protein
MRAKGGYRVARIRRLKAAIRGKGRTEGTEDTEVLRG